MSWEEICGIVTTEPPSGPTVYQDYYTLTSFGMPLPGPDFVDQALRLGDPKPEVKGKGEDKKLAFCGPILDGLYSQALYEQDFNLEVKVKGRRVPTYFIPGHAWGGPVSGPVPARVVVVGKWPGREEAAARRNFVGKSGAILKDALEKFGLRPEDYAGWYMTNVVKHPSADPTSDKPPAGQIKNCMPLLEQELRLVRPEYVLALGAEAFAALVGKAEGSVTQAQGRVFSRAVHLGTTPEPSGEVHNYRVVGCIHPAAVAHSTDNLPAFETGIEGFLRILGGVAPAEPEKPPDHRLVYNETHLAQLVDEILAEDPAPAVAIDCEWHGEYPTEPGAWLRTVQFSHKPGFAACVVLCEEGGRRAFRGDPVPHLRRLLLDGAAMPDPFGRVRRPRLIGHNIRADLPWLKLGLDRQLGDDLIRASNGAETWEATRTEGGFDTMYAAHSVRETDGSYALDILALQYCGVPRYDQALQKWKVAYCKENKIEAKNLDGYGMCPSEVLHPYALWDADVTQRLYRKFNYELLDWAAFGNNCREPFWITMRAHLACLEMEMTGLLIDRKRGEALTEVYLKTRDRLLVELQQMFAWPTFNPQSAQQCKVALFGPEYSDKVDKTSGELIDIRPIGGITLKLKPIKSAGKPSKSWDRIRREELHLYQPCTDKEVLGGLITKLSRDPKRGEPHLPGWEHVVTLRNFRFVGQVLKSVLRPPVMRGQGEIAIDEDDNQEFDAGLLACIYTDGRVHTHIFQTKETGRFSSARPPLQNISKRREKAYKDILGKDYLYALRTMITTTPGYVMAEADYRGAELFMMAIQSSDEKMIDHCVRANLPDGHPGQYDIHSSIAVKAFHLTVDDRVDPVSGKPICELLKTKVGDPLPASKKALALRGMPHIRDVTKTIVFGIPYGRGDAAVVRAVEEEGTQISADDAARIREAVLDIYPKLGPYLALCQRRVTTPGWMRNCFGRYRRFQKMRWGRDDGSMEREAGNFPIQSGVADAVSRALDYLYSRPDRHTEDGRLKYRVVLQIHDAILFEVLPDYLEWFLGDEDHGVHGVVGDCMTRAVPVYQCDLDGKPVPDVAPFYMGTETAVYLHWGEKIKREAGLMAGIPERFLPAA